MKIQILPKSFSLTPFTNNRVKGVSLPILTRNWYIQTFSKQNVSICNKNVCVYTFQAGFVITLVDPILGCKTEVLCVLLQCIVRFIWIGFIYKFYDLHVSSSPYTYIAVNLENSCQNHTVSCRVGAVNHINQMVWFGF